MNNLFIEACRNNQIAIVTRLLQEDFINLHAEDDYALRWASAYGHVAVVKLLQEAMK